MLEDGLIHEWTPLQLAPGLGAVNEPDYPKAITDLNPQRGAHTASLVLGNRSTMARLPCMETEELRAHLEAANMTRKAFCLEE